MDMYDTGATFGRLAGEMLVRFLITMDAADASQEDMDAVSDGFFDGIDEACDNSGMFEPEDLVGENDNGEDQVA